MDKLSIAPVVAVQPGSGVAVGVGEGSGVDVLVGGIVGV